ncbi:MAG: GNAT family N-acetyltransferase [Dehalococcoidia bacterium]|nr:GNAT family N-acetyltransferase [Dehalococcoidia bacterium]
MSTTVRLREPNEGDVPLLDAWNASLAFRGEFNDFGLPPRSANEATEKVSSDDQHGTLIVEADGTPVGTIDWRPAMYGPPPESMAYQLGISLAPEARGKGYGTQALRQVVEYLFATTKVNRIEASCDVENVGSQFALSRAGFRYEGVARGAVPRGQPPRPHPVRLGAGNRLARGDRHWLWPARTPVTLPPRGIVAAPTALKARTMTTTEAIPRQMTTWRTTSTAGSNTSGCTPSSRPTSKRRTASRSCPG